MDQIKENNIEIQNYQTKEETLAEEINKESIDHIDYDDLLPYTGGFGRFQVVLLISTFPFYVFGGFGYFTQLFITQVSPNYWCWIPELENLTDTDRRNLAIPSNDYETFGYSHCSAYDANWRDVILKGHNVHRNWTVKPCQNGWEFNKTEIPYPTISTEMEWICDKASYPATAQSMFFVGAVVGGILFGWISDRFGRLPALVISNLLGCIAGISSTFVRNIVEFSICRFIFGMATDNITMMAYLIVIEYVAPKYRAFVANIPFALVYAPVLVALPWIALSCGDWKIFNLATSIPIGFGLLSPFFIPESPRWLLSKGRIDKVTERLLNIARINKKEIPSIKLDLFKSSFAARRHHNAISLLDYLKRPLLRRTYVCICLMYIFSILVFDALVRTIEHLKYDFFVSFSLISVTELPSLLISAFTLDRLGRRRMMTITMSVCSIFSILTVFVGGGIPSVICAIIARFVANMGLGTAGQWTAELLPTPVRGIANSIVHIVGFVVIIVSPYIAYLERFIYWFPLVLVGCISGSCALLAQTLPETAGIDLPQSLEDAENLVKNQISIKVSCLKKTVKQKIGQENLGFNM